MKNLLIIGFTFPEPSTTAAGVRMMQLIDFFLSKGYKITFASTASISDKSVDFTSLEISTKEIKLNDSSFDVFVKELNPDIVLFDRFLTEEQFGWRVAENCPNSIRILDTEDLHFLRKARGKAYKTDTSFEKINLFTEVAKRELASILRSDLSLIISEYEVELLENTFKISDDTLHYLPFMMDKLDEKEIVSLPTFEERNHFITMGNFQHAPNLDAVIYLKKKIWPLIRKQLPEAQIHIYGAYVPTEVATMNDEKEGFLIKGWAENITEVLKNSRVCLAPLQFGAGLKGKLFDAMKSGTPSVTTSIGAEGINGSLSFGGFIEDSIEKFVKASVLLYTEKDEWQTAQQSGFNILDKRFNSEEIKNKFGDKLGVIFKNIEDHRQSNIIGQILQHQSLQATKYLSKWIEEKNKVN